MTTLQLVESMDADDWAQEFVRRVKSDPSIATDVDTMRAWFANAIMVGYDRGRPVCGDQLAYMAADKLKPIQ